MGLISNSAASVPTHAGVVSITEIKPSTLVEGGAVVLEATGHSGFTGLTTAPVGTVYDPEYHEITHIWTVNGSPLSNFTAPTALVTGWNNPNVAYGKRVTFHFPDSGSYTVDLWCIGPNGETAIASTTTITVATADATFPTTQTIVYADNADFTGHGKTGAQEISTLSALSTALKSASGPMRVLFKRGETISPTSSQRLLINGTGDYLNHVDAWGTGNDPIIQMWDRADDNFAANGFIYFAKSNSGTTPNEVTFFNCRNIDFRGNWEANTVTGKAGASPFYFRDHGNQDTFFCISDCSFDGLFEVITSSGNDNRQQMVLANLTITNWQDYGTYSVNHADSDYHILGCSIRHHVGAINATKWGKNNLGPRHGPVRMPEVGHFGIRCSSFFSRTGWSGTDPWDDQACIRAFSNGNVNNSSSNFDRMVCEGGAQQIAWGGHDTTLAESDGNHLVDKALLVAEAKSYDGFVRADFGGTTIRNVYGIMPNVPRLTGVNGWIGAIHFKPNGNSTASNYDSPIKIYGNTFVNMRSAANDSGDSWPLTTTTGTAFDIVTTDNNIRYAPDIDTPVTTPDSIMDETPTVPGVTAAYAGTRNYPEEWMGEASGQGTTANGANMTFSYPSGTNQAYWQGRAAGDNKDALNDGTAEGSSKYYAEDGDFTISFDASVITVTNTSGSSWTSASRQLLLDYGSNAAALALDATYASPTSLNLVRPDTGSAALDPGTGLFPYDDFDSPGTSASGRGANPDAGAVQVSV